MEVTYHIHFILLRINPMIIPLVLAGGSGTRLWPLSRELFPKQLLNLTDDHSMLQNTLLRLQDAAGMTAPLIVCNETPSFYGGRAASTY